MSYRHCGVMFEYYTVARANAALPMINKKYAHVMKCRSAVMRAEQELQMGATASAKLEEYSARKQKLNSQLTAFYSAIEDLEKTGVVIKGLEDGLLDFPSRRFDEDVWLCWKYGEDEVKFWHEKDSGFGSRKPLVVSDESLV